MKNRYLVDINKISNGQGDYVYGGRLEAYSFEEKNAMDWLGDFAEEVISAVGNHYFPVYRIADGEMRFLFGLKVNWKKDKFRSFIKFLRYEIFKGTWKTSWDESYPPARVKFLRKILRNYVAEIASIGKLAIYWNENGLHAFTEYNSSMEFLFNELGLTLNAKNYIPFHFCQALIAQYSHQILHNKNVLIVSGLSDEEFKDLNNQMMEFGCSHVELFKCSRTSALLDDYTHLIPAMPPDVVLVAAGIGAAKVVVELRHLNCPVLDIGSYIHVLSGKDEFCHAGFFVSPFNSNTKPK